MSKQFVERTETKGWSHDAPATDKQQDYIPVDICSIVKQNHAQASNYAHNPVIESKVHSVDSHEKTDFCAI